MPARKIFDCLDCGSPCARPAARCLMCYRLYQLTTKRTRADRIAYIRAWQRKVKDETFAAYGGYRCACCDETDPVFLVIDHINGGGNQERRSIGPKGTRGGAGEYWWLRKQGFPAGYQVLCHNCNFAKTRGECPHAVGIREAT